MQRNEYWEQSEKPFHAPRHLMHRVLLLVAEQLRLELLERPITQPTCVSVQHSISHPRHAGTTLATLGHSNATLSELPASIYSFGINARYHGLRADGKGRLRRAPVRIQPSRARFWSFSFVAQCVVVLFSRALASLHHDLVMTGRRATSMSMSL